MSSHKEERRESIIDAAYSLYNDRGGAQFTVDEVANRAGVARVTVYRYFRTKRDLLRSLQDERNVIFTSRVLRDTRDRIFDAAEKIIQESGLRKVTVHEIADEAGLGAATIYRHFGDRDQLMNAFIEDRTPRDEVEGKLKEGSPAEIRTGLELFAASLIRMITEKHELLQLVAAEHPENSQRLKLFLAAQEHTGSALRAFFGKLVAKGKFKSADPDELTLVFCGLCLSFGWFMPIVGMDRPHPEANAKALVSIFLDGLLA